MLVYIYLAYFLAFQVIYIYNHFYLSFLISFSFSDFFNSLLLLLFITLPIRCYQHNPIHIIYYDIDGIFPRPRQDPA